MTRIMVIFSLVLLALLNHPGLVSAGDEACDSGDCRSTRIINQWACEYCTQNWYCLSGGQGCGGESDKTTCGPYDTCTFMCPKTAPASRCRDTGTTTVACNTSLYNCAWNGTLTNCYDSYGSCTGTHTTVSMGCCVAGTAPTPTPTADPTGTPAYSCSVTIAGASGVMIGGTGTLTATVSQSNGSYTSVTMVPVDGTGGIDPSGASSGTTIDITGLTAGTAQVIARVERNGTIKCETTKDITVTAPAVTINVWQSNSRLLCAQDSAVGGTVRLHNGAGYDQTQSLSGGTTTFTNPPTGTSLAVVTPTDATLASLGGCVTSPATVVVPGGSYTHDLYLTAQRAPWWQAKGRDAHAPGIANYVA